MIDLNKLNTNGPDHAYKLGGYRTLLWQPTWLDMQLSAEDKEGDEEPDEAQLGGAFEVNEGPIDSETGLPPGLKK